MEELVIRPARDTDLAGVLTLYEHLHPRDPVVTPDAARASWSALLSSPLTTVFVVEAAGELVATCKLAIIPNLTRGVRPFGVIENVVTHPSRRRTGLARKVLQAALDAAWEAGCYKVTLATGRRDEETLGFYERSGFERGGKTYFEARRP